MADTAISRTSSEPIRGRWLVFTGVLLAFLIEVFPTEADLLFFAALERNFAAFFAIKLLCLAMICTPVVIFIVLNHGQNHAMREVGVRLSIIALILLINLTMNCAVIYNMLWEPQVSYFEC